MTIIYGIKNCDTVKKARKWLDNQGISYEFHDFREQGLDEALLNQFVSLSDWSQLMNKRSTTFRQLPDDLKASMTDQQAFEQVMQQPTLIKRPVLLHGEQLFVGFKDAQYQEIFS